MHGRGGAGHGPETGGHDALGRIQLGQEPERPRDIGDAVTRVVDLDPVGHVRVEPGGRRPIARILRTTPRGDDGRSVGPVGAYEGIQVIDLRGAIVGQAIGPLGARRRSQQRADEECPDRGRGDAGAGSHCHGGAPRA